MDEACYIDEAAVGLDAATLGLLQTPEDELFRP